MCRRLIVVTGATGGSIARELLTTEEWHIRAMTRNAKVERAQDLAAMGMEVAEPNCNDEKSSQRAFTVVLTWIVSFDHF